MLIWWILPDLILCQHNKATPTPIGKNAVCFSTSLTGEADLLILHQPECLSCYSIDKVIFFANDVLHFIHSFSYFNHRCAPLKIYYFIVLVWWHHLPSLLFVCSFYLRNGFGPRVPCLHGISQCGLILAWWHGWWRGQIIIGSKQWRSVRTKVRWRCSL